MVETEHKIQLMARSYFEESIDSPLDETAGKIVGLLNIPIYPGWISLLSRARRPGLENMVLPDQEQLITNFQATQHQIIDQLHEAWNLASDAQRRAAINRKWDNLPTILEIMSTTARLLPDEELILRVIDLLSQAAKYKPELREDILSTSRRWTVSDYGLKSEKVIAKLQMLSE